MKKRNEPQVQCYLCKRVFAKYIPGAAHNRNYYRCHECLDQERNSAGQTEAEFWEAVDRADH